MPCSLLAAATLDAAKKRAIRDTGHDLVTILRANRKRTGVEALGQEYALSSEEGVALICLAEALLRIPDDATRDTLIRDKICEGDWRSRRCQDNANRSPLGIAVAGRNILQNMRDCHAARAAERLCL